MEWDCLSIQLLEYNGYTSSQQPDIQEEAPQTLRSTRRRTLLSWARNTLGYVSRDC